MRRIAVLLITVMMVAELATGASAVGQAPETGTPAIAAEIPATPVGEALGWVLTVLNDGGASLTRDEITAHIAPSVLAQAPPELVMGLMQQLAADAPFTFEGFTRAPTANQVNALLIGRSGSPLVVPLSVETASPHRVTGVTFAPVPRRRVCPWRLSRRTRSPWQRVRPGRTRWGVLTVSLR